MNSIISTGLTHIVSRETLEPDSDFSCRIFVPIVGIDEGSTTETSNGSLLCYMKI
ncbi:MAG TPA: PhzF family phenazine biosynthesis protein [Clostridiales bacterium]|nr:PhzF family phenazine biosynthesis protein [Clostridiales bacterium]